jgi:methionyl aminopeptidase
VNDVVVHGIPSDEVVLKDGDIISIDCGAIVDGWHGDAAYTAFVGSGHAPELIELSRVTEESMWAGIAAMPAHMDSSVTRESSRSSGAWPEPTKAV